MPSREAVTTKDPAWRGCAKLVGTQVPRATKVPERPRPTARHWKSWRHGIREWFKYFNTCSNTQTLLQAKSTQVWICLEYLDSNFAMVANHNFLKAETLFGQIETFFFTGIAHPTKKLLRSK